MADRSFDSLIPEIAPSVPGCPYPMIVSQIRNAAIRSCERTLAWRHQAPVFPLEPNVQEYEYSKPSNTDVHAVFEVFVNNRPLQPFTLDQMVSKLRRNTGGMYNIALEDEGNLLTEQNSEFLGDTPDNVQTGVPTAIYQVSPDTFRLYPVPDDDRMYEMYMFMALKPKRTATGMDEGIFNELQDVIIHGTLQHLLVMPNKNWQDRELASYHAKQYIFHLTERRARANLGNARGTMTAKMQAFGV